VIDPGNGSSGHVFRALVEKLGLKAALIHEEPDGRFPNRGPNPVNPESRAKLAAAVLEAGADFGAGLDGDGDRLVFVDERGEALENYFLGALISDEMVAAGAVFGCETSGHVYFRVSDSFYTESAAYALVLVLKLLDKKGKPLSELVSPLISRYVQLPEWNVEVSDKEKVMAAVEARFAGVADIGRLDGLSVSTPEAWFNIRPSNTEPLLRIRLEAVDAKAAASQRAEIEALLKTV
jgi:phosphomannomutase